MIMNILSRKVTFPICSLKTKIMFMSTTTKEGGKTHLSIQIWANGENNVSSNFFYFLGYFKNKIPWSSSDIPVIQVGMFMGVEGTEESKRVAGCWVQSSTAYVCSKLWFKKEEKSEKCPGAITHTFSHPLALTQTFNTERKYSYIGTFCHEGKRLYQTSLTEIWK